MAKGFFRVRRIDFLKDFSPEKAAALSGKINCEYLKQGNRCGSSSYTGNCYQQDKAICPSYRTEKFLEARREASVGLEGDLVG